MNSATQNISIHTDNDEYPEHLMMLSDAKIKLNSIISHFHQNLYWPNWIYLEIEKKWIHQNTARLLRTDQMNHVHHLSMETDLLHQNMFGSWNMIDEHITSTIPAFIHIGDSFFHNTESNINAMLKAFSLSSLFITLTFSE